LLKKYIVWILIASLPCGLFILYSHYTNYKNLRDDCISDINEIYDMLNDDITYWFKNMLHDNIPIQEYIKTSEITSSQMNYQIITSLKSMNGCNEIIIQNDTLVLFNKYIQEIIIIANIFDVSDIHI